MAEHQLALMLEADLSSQLSSKISVNADTGCWEWTAGRDSYGYAKVKVRGFRTRKAHRVIYEILVGPIPEGLTLDHLCRIRHCVRPSHLEPVTRRENVMRGHHPAVVAHVTGICVAGLHDITGDGAYVDPMTGRRRCRQCHREWRRVRTLTDAS